VVIEHPHPAPQVENSRPRLFRDAPAPNTETSMSLWWTNTGTAGAEQPHRLFRGAPAPRQQCASVSLW